MDLLKIKDKEAFFCMGNGTEKLVSQVTTDDINQALELLLDSEGIGLALGDDATVIANPAQRIMFERLRMSFKEVLDSKRTIKAEIDAVFAQAEAKYLNSAE
ncbi:MAG: hypothetical protein IKF78_11670 [Atopobiaceae bacterium]|nr:hypothetical protein [Atopobiaceae bacterium]